MTHSHSDANLHHFSLAPMMAWTCPYGRYLMRQIAPNLRLYSEMLVDQSIIHGNRHRLLAHHANEFPLAFQLASANPTTLAQAIRALHDHTESTAIAEINLNVGCPSPRVQAGGFGACLMKDPVLLGELVAAMHETSRVPISVKMRLGVDDHTGYERLIHLTEILQRNHCTHLILHARTAWLKGLDPKKNRTIPQLDYNTVHRLKADKPDMRIIINGGLAEKETCLEQLRHVDGVMIGRAAFANPWLMAELNAALFATEIPTFEAILQKMLPFWQESLAQGARPQEMLRSAMNLISGVSGAKLWRTTLTDLTREKNPHLESLLKIAA